MDILDFEIFREVAKHGSISKAADNLGYAQSTITSRIKKLEQSFDTTVFHRRSRGVSLTHKGKILLDYSNRILKIMEKAKSSVNDLDIIQGDLSIGAMETVAILHLPTLFNNFRGYFPEVNLSLLSGLTAELVPEVIDYKLDAAFVNAPINHEKLSFIEAYEEELVLVGSPNVTKNFSFEKPKSINILAFRRGCSYRAKMEHFFFNKGILINTTSEFGSLEAILSSLKAGLGISILPISIVKRYLESGELEIIKVNSSDFITKTILIWRNDIELSAQLQCLIDMIENK